MCGERMTTAESQWLSESCLGRGLPQQAEQHLRLAGLSYHEDTVAEAHLRAAQAAAPEHIAVQIGFYRYYFYKGRLTDALAVAERCLRWAATMLGLNNNWRRVTATDAMFDSFDAILPRFFLFTLKGYAYLQMRVGQQDEGMRAAVQLTCLDSSDKLGGKRLLQVFERQGRDDDE